MTATLVTGFCPACGRSELGVLPGDRAVVCLNPHCTNQNAAELMLNSDYSKHQVLIRRESNEFEYRWSVRHPFLEWNTGIIWSCVEIDDMLLGALVTAAARRQRKRSFGLYMLENKKSGLKLVKV